MRPGGAVIRNERVRYMDVCNSPITSPPIVAGFLSELLPGLKIIGVDPYIKYRAMWTEVATQHCGWSCIEMFRQGELRARSHGLDGTVIEIGEEWDWTLGSPSDSGNDDLCNGGFWDTQRSRTIHFPPFQSLSAL